MKEKTYQGYTLAEAKEELDVWKAAKRAAATGQSYTIGSRQLTRYNLSEIDKQIKAFASIVDTLSSGRSGSLIKVRARMHRW